MRAFNRTAAVAAGVVLGLLPRATRAGFIAGEITQNGDPVVGLVGTTAGGANTLAALSDFGSGGSDGPAHVIDDNTGTKYLNFNNAGTNTGFVVSPLAGATVARSIVFYTANASPEADPLTVTVEGTTATADLAQQSGFNNWVLLYNGPSGLATDPGRRAHNNQPVAFPNNTAYSSYRVLVTATRGPGQTYTQYSEALLSTAAPEPASAGLLAVSGVALLARRRRR